MAKSSKTLVFFGSGPVAGKSLEFLLRFYDIEAVITKEPVNKENTNPVGEVATHKGLDIHIAKNKEELDLVFNNLQPFSAAGLVVDYGVIIGPDVLAKFPLGIINSHFSLLPEWRGADPITYSLLSGQRYTGVTLMKITHGLDEGDILAKTIVDIDKNDNNQTLTDKLIIVSNQLIKSKLNNYLSRQIQLQSQNNTPITYSTKISKDDGLIRWSKTATEIEREVRAYSRWPKSFCRLGHQDVIIDECHVIKDTLKPGAITITDNQELIIGCRIGSLNITKIQPNGKKIMSIKEFLNGYRQKLMAEVD
jgi:methionyl-tRNA formyltransferase